MDEEDMPMYGTHDDLYAGLHDEPEQPKELTWWELLKSLFN
jgi:hypothetical protein